MRNHQAAYKTMFAFASDKEESWKPVVKALGLESQVYQIICDAVDLAPDDQMYLGEPPCRPNA